MQHSLKKCLEVLKCPRKYFAKYRARLPDPKSSWLQFGIDFHKVCEGYLRTGQLCQRLESGEYAMIAPESHIGTLARAALPSAPRGALPETSQRFVLFDREVECHIDWIAPDWSEFGDWKSSGGHGELTDATLHTDIQANWQAHGIMHSAGLDTIRGRWTYADKRTGKGGASVTIREACGTFRVSETLAFLKLRVLPAFRLIELFETLDPPATPLSAIPHDVNACEGVGKWCAFLGRCRPSMPSTGPTLIQLRTAAGVTP